MNNKSAGRKVGRPSFKEVYGEDYVRVTAHIPESIYKIIEKESAENARSTAAQLRLIVMKHYKQTVKRTDR